MNSSICKKKIIGLRRKLIHLPNNSSNCQINSFVHEKNSSKRSLLIFKCKKGSGVCKINSFALKINLSENSSSVIKCSKGSLDSKVKSFAYKTSSSLFKNNSSEMS